MIPNAAIEAAAKAIYEAGGWNDDDPWTGTDWRVDCARTEALAALEGAAPFIAAAAFQRGYLSALGDSE